MTAPKVFLASSSEGLAVVAAVHKLLRQALDGAADVIEWTDSFLLTRTYIESLERILRTSDFAVLVFTPDDWTTSRGAEGWSPRDNVVFELGLFIGQFGRDRCFFIQRRDLDLKLPSDLLGIEAASFSMPSGQDLETALETACARIGQAIHDAITVLPSRPKLGDAERAAQAAMRMFGDRITGTWWERIQLKGAAPALSFLSIDQDDAHNSVRLGGTAYGSDGVHVANWRSAAARLEGNRIVYVRECRRLDAETPAWLPGWAEVTLDDSADVIDRGSGRFWETHESHPEATVSKSVDLRRNLDESHALTMRKGSDAEKKDLVRKTLGSW